MTNMAILCEEVTAQKAGSTNEALREAALAYHAYPRPGKISVELTKPASTQRDLTLAYSPGVAEPVREIARDPAMAYRYTAKGNLVAVISDGSAILGLGDLGPLASKPVMEGKGILFKRFAGIDVFDIEVDSQGIDTFVETVRSISPTFGGINLEDIKAPACFEIERRLQAACNIPVFHDDQHGTAIVVCAGLLNALQLQQKSISDIRVVCVGAGAAGIASIRLLVAMGARRENILMLDSKGVVHTGRDDLNAYKREFAVTTLRRTLADALDGADVFIGVSSADLLTPDLLLRMAERPIVFALANPDPEIRPERARAVRSDVIVATGRSDYPNQVNNVLGFPYIFRGALDVRAREINDAMKLACIHALASLVHEAVPDSVLSSYGAGHLVFGPDYIIPKPNDPRLLGIVSAAVAKAAVDSGVAALDYPAHYPLRDIESIFPV